MTQNLTHEDGLAAHIKAAAAGRAEQMLARVRHYVEQETPTGGAASLEVLIHEIASRHRELGGTIRLTGSDGGSHLVADFAGTGAKANQDPVLLVGHADTVWPAGQLDAAMPWRLEDGTARGPGVYDMKSGLVVMETALEIVQELGIEHRPVRIIITSDEEIGSPTSRDMVARAGTRVAAALGFESPHPDGALKTARRGSSRVRLAVTGREAHAALDPDQGVSAIDELVDQLMALRAIIAEVTAAGGSVLSNVGVLDGGGRTNVVPGSAAAEVGLRFEDAATEQLVLERIRALQPKRDGARVEVQLLSSRPAWAPSENTDELLAKVQNAGSLVGQAVQGRPAAGAADTNLLGSMGIPTLDGFGPRGAGAHAVHEQIVVDSLAERAALLTAVLSEL